MSTIKAFVRDGRVEVAQPIDLPDGTELTIMIPGLPETLGTRDEDWSDAPEAIEAWIRWYDALEPLEFTAEERDALAAARREDKERELARWDRRSQQIEGLFP